MKLIADVNFDMSYSFIFSARPGTPAADMVDDVPEEEKEAASVYSARTYQSASDGMEPSDARHHPAYSGRRYIA